MKIKSITIIIIAIIVIIPSIVYAETINNNSNINIKIDDLNIVFDDNTGYPFIDNNFRTQVPLRVIMETIGANVSWDSETNIVIAKKDNIKVEIPIGKEYIYRNGCVIPNDTVSQIINGRTYLPIRIVLEAFGAKVIWDSFSKTVFVYYKNNYEITHNILNILINFTDIKITSTPKEWNDLWFNNEYNVNKYYNDMSFNRLGFLPVFENYGSINDSTVEVSVPYEHPNWGPLNLNYRLCDLSPIVRDVLKQADPYVNFCEYDSDDNGVITNDEIILVLIPAGYEMNYVPCNEKSINSHFNMLNNEISENLDLDGVTFSSYIMLSEKIYCKDLDTESIATPGILCHEIGHSLGLPDLYDTDYSSSGIGFHSLMGNGATINSKNSLPGCIPISLDAWSRVRLDFSEPTVVTESGIYSLYSQDTDNYNIIKIPTSNPNEFFLLENKQLTGYDKPLSDYLKRGGIAIWHIDESVINKNIFYNSINNDEDHKGVDLEEASQNRLKREELDENNLLNTNKLFNHYYNSRSISTFSNSKLYDGSSTGIKVKVLSGDEEIRVEITITN